MAQYYLGRKNNFRVCDYIWKQKIKKQTNNVWLVDTLACPHTWRNIDTLVSLVLLLVHTLIKIKYLIVMFLYFQVWFQLQLIVPWMGNPSFCSIDTSGKRCPGDLRSWHLGFVHQFEHTNEWPASEKWKTLVLHGVCFM